MNVGKGLQRLLASSAVQVEDQEKCRTFGIHAFRQFARIAGVVEPVLCGKFLHALHLFCGEYAVRCNTLYYSIEDSRIAAR